MKKVVLVTGGAKGIGKQIVLDFANLGYDVIINYNKSEKEAKAILKAVLSLGSDAMIIKADVSKESEVESMFNRILQKYGTLDCLVNNSGICEDCLLIDQSYASIKKILDVNLYGTIICSKHAAKIMASNMSGKIINISSIWGERGGSMETVYSASKAGVIGLTKAMAKEYGLNHVCVNAICPGVIDTDMCKCYDESVREELKNATPFGRLGEPSDVSGIVTFLASDKADFITGQVITVDGGIEI